METLKRFEEQYECVKKFLTTFHYSSYHLFILTEDKAFYEKFEDEEENPILKAIADARASVVIGGIRPYIFSRKPIYPYDGSDEFESRALETIWFIKSPAEKALMDAYLTNFPEEQLQVVRFE